MVSLVKNSKWDDETKVPTLVQIFQAENAPVRKQVVEQLAALKGEKASAALAQRAIFDLSPEVRQVAVAALKDRPIAEFRSALLGGMRYPWVPVAEHAAEAFVALKDRESALSLAPLLDLPNPMAPVREKENKWTVTEVVRINHLRNCLMCHAPSFNRQEPIRGLVPEKGQPLAEVYYESQRGTFVRADVVYLKQDFSITQTVLNAQPWPERQRFDYLVRKRELSKKEIEEIGAADKERSVGEDHHRAAALWRYVNSRGRMPANGAKIGIESCEQHPGRRRKADKSKQDRRQQRNKGDFRGFLCCLRFATGLHSIRLQWSKECRTR